MGEICQNLAKCKNGLETDWRIPPRNEQNLVRKRHLIDILMHKTASEAPAPKKLEM